ncbi:MAG TPA: HNH endonuclease signature motif containing protein, partial [Polyangiaceae bacterium]|nr:HNH endonuclease signature motif containing protein [Polyangiaceae bacterium]
MRVSRRHRVLAIVATDATFESRLVRGERTWVGRCIHCNTRVAVSPDGDPEPGVTVEHIEPRHHGGGDDLENLALACARCNQGKGMRHDHKRRDDPTLTALVATLRERRRQRWRDPDGAGGSEWMIVAEIARRVLRLQQQQEGAGQGASFDGS